MAYKCFREHFKYQFGQYLKVPLPKDVTPKLQALPVWVYDKHTSKSVDRSYQFFFDKTTDYVDIDHVAKQLYIRSNLGAAYFYSNPSDGFVDRYLRLRRIVSNHYIEPEWSFTDMLLYLRIAYFIERGQYEGIQTQLITAKYKPRTLFVRLMSEETFRYILKGPFKEETVDKLIYGDKLKRILGLEPLNCRKYKLSDEDVCWFAVSDCKYVIDSTKLEQRTSKLEGEVNVYSGEKHGLTHSMVNIELFKVLAYRRMIETNDTCNSNILELDQHFISIDDEPFMKTVPETMFKKRLPDAQQIPYERFRDEHFDEIVTFLDEWLVRLSSIQVDHQERLLSNVERLKNVENWLF